MSNDELRANVIQATLDLAAERSILAVGLADIAARAGLSLAAVRARYDDRIAILADFARLIDERMLAGGEAEAGEPPRERLLDVMMRRFDALVPYRAGLKGIRAAARRDPLFAATLNHIAVGSQKWTLAAARLEPSGPFAPARRLARAEALVLVAASVLPTFLEDTAPDLPKTMAALDAALKRLDRVAQVVTRMEAMVDRICARGPGGRKRSAGSAGTDTGGPDTDVAAAGGAGGPHGPDAPSTGPDVGSGFGSGVGLGAGMGDDRDDGVAITPATSLAAHGRPEMAMPTTR